MIFRGACMNLIPAKRWWSIAAPAPAARGPWVSCSRRDSPRLKTWPAGYLPGLTVSIPRCRSIRPTCEWRSSIGLRQDLNRSKNRQRCRLDFRLVFFLCIGNLFVAGRQFYIFNLLLPGFVVELGAAFLGLPDHFRKPVLRFIVGRLLVHG